MTADEERLLRLAELAEAGLAAASLVHELRQPVFALKATAQLAREAGGLDVAGLEGLLSTVGHLEDLLDAWAGVGREDEEGVYDAAQVVRDAVSMLRPRARHVGAALAVDLPPALLAQGRPSVARQVATNLLQNALDAVEGQPERAVAVRARAEGGFAVLEVVDTGPGVAPLVAGRVFEPFVTTRVRRGTGLGLYVARSLCEAAGGRVELLPASPGTRARAQFASLASDEAGAGPMKKA